LYHPPRQQIARSAHTAVVQRVGDVLEALTPAAWVCRTTGSTFAAKASAAFLLAGGALCTGLGQVGAVAERPSPSPSGSPPAHSDYDDSRDPDATCIISCQGDPEAWPVAFA
jgi:hypothetical protein